MHFVFTVWYDNNERVWIGRQITQLRPKSLCFRSIRQMTWLPARWRQGGPAAQAACKPADDTRPFVPSSASPCHSPRSQPLAASPLQTFPASLPPTVKQQKISSFSSIVVLFYGGIYSMLRESQVFVIEKIHIRGTCITLHFMHMLVHYIALHMALY